MKLRREIARCIREQRTFSGERIDPSAEGTKAKAAETVRGCLQKLEVSLEGQAQLQEFLTERAARHTGL